MWPDDGTARGLRSPRETTSAADRAPVRRDISVSQVPASGSRPLLVPLAAHCRWVQILDDGGSGGVLIFPGRSRASAEVAKVGQFVWLPDGFFGITDNGTPPTTAVKVKGWTAEDATIAASGAAAASSSSSTGDTPNDTVTESVELDGTPQTYSPPAGTISTVVTLYDAGSSVAVGTDASVPVNVGPAAQLSSWTHYGETDIFMDGVNTEFIIFTNYLKV